MGESLIDCENGRRLGCATFCCRLLVRLDESERQGGKGGAVAKGCIDKAADGLCIHLDRASHRCDIWHRRPRVCREFNCNGAPMLLAAVHFGVKNIVQLSRDALNLDLSGDARVEIPALEGSKKNPD